ncbi:hypothetical protein CAPTEDRAFT_144144 [Capitella teleta]|uniref:Very-long-chain (3R)-3-hydroxyacyl-CoA dehydratase n=1 Tax=Capitella teleta TaxID=283909 RepID=R7T5T3_CAPTE|nr:hypothetical protein CAPTEDRAFT_144144 [Capitella teleta]|eukprot:ELT88670.1 hypothetical protein CAPTEDRAFT_144144 [Capitella teleta]
MEDRLNPFVFWGQNKEKIFVKVDLSDAKDLEVTITEDSLKLTAFGNGIRGKNKYGLDFDFYLPIDSDASKYRNTGRHVEFQIAKVGIGETWPRLMENPKKPAWLKIDFDHFAFEEDDDSSPEMDEHGDYKMTVNYITHSFFYRTISSMLSFYLFLYNMFQWIGFSYVFFVICGRYVMQGTESKPGTYEAVGPQLIICQLTAVLEVIHPLLGWVKTGALMPFLQVGGRNLILFGILMQEPEMQTKGIVWWLFVTWSCVEIVRYPFYMLSTFKTEWQAVTWLRYSMWIPLYPLGFFCEGFVMMLSLPYFERSGRWSFALPNELNMSFHFPTFLRIYMCLFLIGGYLLMKQMYEQRKKKLPPTNASRKSKLKAK